METIRQAILLAFSYIQGKLIRNLLATELIQRSCHNPLAQPTVRAVEKAKNAMSV
jgi:hypothetical protein